MIFFRHTLVVFLAFCFCLSANAQQDQKPLKPFKIKLPKTEKETPSDQELAAQYFMRGEHNKAAQIFEKLHKKDPKDRRVFTKYIESLKNDQQFEKALTSIDNAEYQTPYALENIILKASIYEDMGETDQAKTIYTNAIEKTKENIGQSASLGYYLDKVGKINYSIEAYKNAQELTVNKTQYALNLAELYRQLDEREEMLEYYFLAIPKFKDRVQGITYRFDKYLNDDEIINLQKKIYRELKDPNAEFVYNKVLVWTYLKTNDFNMAFRQARALDRKTNAEGIIVYEYANMTKGYEDYAAAIKGYDYILNEVENFKYKKRVEYEKFYAQYQIIKDKKIDAPSELEVLTTDFDTYISKNPVTNATASSYLLAADYEGHYRRNSTKAIETLNKVIAVKRLHKRISSEAKINLADLLLITGDRWESTLLYSQVDKKMKDAPQGEQARFKNAMLSYYMGDFDWALQQFDVLKRATSKLISNDAIDMSIFINDHLTVDSIDVPLTKFAKSDLLIFQNRFKEAEQVLDSIAVIDPKNRLIDDIVYRKANMAKDQKDYDKAIKHYNTIINDHKKSIKVDNSIFEMAEIYDKYLNKPKKAGALYKQLFLDYVTSTLAVEARKRYRAIREEYPDI